MRWRTDRDGWRPWGDGKKLWQVSGLPNRVRCQAFIHNRLWIGLLPVFIGGFGIVTLLCLLEGAMMPREAFLRGFTIGALCGVGYLIGIWLAVEAGVDGREVPEQSGAVDTTTPGRPIRRRSAPYALILLLPICLRAEWIYEGDRTGFQEVVEIVVTFLVLACVLVPVWIAKRKREV